MLIYGLTPRHPPYRLEYVERGQLAPAMVLPCWPLRARKALTHPGSSAAPSQEELGRPALFGNRGQREGLKQEATVIQPRDGSSSSRWTNVEILAPPSLGHLPGRSVETAADQPMHWLGSNAGASPFAASDNRLSIVDNAAPLTPIAKEAATRGPHRYEVRGRSQEVVLRGNVAADGRSACAGTPRFCCECRACPCQCT